MIDVCIFPASLKTANITPVYKKGSKNPTKKKLQAGQNFQCGFRQGLSEPY